MTISNQKESNMSNTDTRFIAYQFKLAAKRQKEQNRLKNMTKTAKVKKRNYGCHSELPTDTKWDDVFQDMRSGHRFYDDKQVKGRNSMLTKAICQL